MVIEISDEQIYEHLEKQQNTQYCGNFKVIEPYLIENLSGLTLCPKCLQPHGKMRLLYGGWVEQHCECEKQDDPKWGDGRDFNLGYETCYCCGLEVIVSGSRYSPFFCQDCKKAIRKFNDAIGTCVIPIGRHHYLNDKWFNKTPPLYEPPSLFSSESKSIGELMDRAREQKAFILRHQLKILKLPEDTNLMMLMKTSFSIDRKRAKKEALLSIIEHILKSPPKIIPYEPYTPKIESYFISEVEISCVFYTVVIRNESVNQICKGGIKAFVAEHGVKYNDDLTVMIFMAPSGIENTEEMLEKLGFKYGDDFTWFDATEMARRKPIVKRIPFKAKWLKGYCKDGRAYVSLVQCQH
jgi:hypothetical protein